MPAAGDCTVTSPSSAETAVETFVIVPILKPAVVIAVFAAVSLPTCYGRYWLFSSSEFYLQLSYRYADKSPINTHASVLSLTSVAEDHWARNLRPGVPLTVTPPAPATVKVPAPFLSISILSPVAKPWDAFVGTVSVIAPALSIVTNFAKSDRTKV